MHSHYERKHSYKQRISPFRQMYGLAQPLSKMVKHEAAMMGISEEEAKRLMKHEPAGDLYTHRKRKGVE